MQSNRVSELDEKHLRRLRENVSNLLFSAGRKYDGPGIKLLDVAPQDHGVSRISFPRATIETLDIDLENKPTYVVDLCKDNSDSIVGESFDVVVCTEVLEHTRQPFDAVNEIFRLLRMGGVALISTPFNFRIHGPLPDCWRFTEHGLRELFSPQRGFRILDLSALEDEDRFLMPIHYTLIAEKVALHVNP